MSMYVAKQAADAGLTLSQYHQLADKLEAMVKQVATDCTKVCMDKHYAMLGSDLDEETELREFFRGVRSGRKVMAAECARDINKLLES